MWLWHVVAAGVLGLLAGGRRLVVCGLGRQGADVAGLLGAHVVAWAVDEAAMDGRCGALRLQAVTLYKASVYTFRTCKSTFNVQTRNHM